MKTRRRFAIALVGIAAVGAGVLGLSTRDSKASDQPIVMFGLLRGDETGITEHVFLGWKFADHPPVDELPTFMGG